MIIPVHHIVVANVPVQATTTLEQGYAVGLDSNGFAIVCDGAADNAGNCIGFSADRNRDAEAYEYVNRVSDMGNDTAGSGLLSVYTGGIFYFDVDEGASGNLETPLGTAVRGAAADENFTPGDALYVDGSGRLTAAASAASQIVGYVMEGNTELESGIPGEYEPGSSLSLVDDTQPRQWIKVKITV